MPPMPSSGLRMMSQCRRALHCLGAARDQRGRDVSGNSRWPASGWQRAGFVEDPAPALGLFQQAGGVALVEGRVLRMMTAPASASASSRRPPPKPGSSVPSRGHRVISPGTAGHHQRAAQRQTRPAGSQAQIWWPPAPPRASSRKVLSFDLETTPAGSATKSSFMGLLRRQWAASAAQSQRQAAGDPPRRPSRCRPRQATASPGRSAPRHRGGARPFSAVASLPAMVPSSASPATAGHQLAREGRQQPATAAPASPSSV